MCVTQRHDDAMKSKHHTGRDTFKIKTVEKELYGRDLHVIAECYSLHTTPLNNNQCTVMLNQGNACEVNSKRSSCISTAKR